MFEEDGEEKDLMTVHPDDARRARALSKVQLTTFVSEDFSGSIDKLHKIPTTYSIPSKPIDGGSMEKDTYD